MDSNIDRFDDELKGLLGAYRESVLVPEAGAQFMPRLWERIEARKNFTFRLKKLSQVFVAAAAFLCLVMTGVNVMSSEAEVHQRHATYVDVLAEAQPAENVAALGILPRGDGAEATR